MGDRILRLWATITILNGCLISANGMCMPCPDTIVIRIQRLFVVHMRRWQWAYNNNNNKKRRIHTHGQRSQCNAFISITIQCFLFTLLSIKIDEQRKRKLKLKYQHVCTLLHTQTHTLREIIKCTIWCCAMPKMLQLPLPSSFYSIVSDWKLLRFNYFSEFSERRMVDQN